MSQKIACSCYGYAAINGSLGLSKYFLAHFHSIRSLDLRVSLTFLVPLVGISSQSRVLLNHRCPFLFHYSLSEFVAST